MTSTVSFRASPRSKSRQGSLQRVLSVCHVYDVHFSCADVGFWRSCPLARFVCLRSPPEQKERCCAAAGPNELKRDLDFFIVNNFNKYVDVDCCAACYAEDARAAAPQEYCAAQIWASNLLIINYRYSLKGSMFLKHGHGRVGQHYSIFWF